MSTGECIFVCVYACICGATITGLCVVLWNRKPSGYDIAHGTLMHTPPQVTMWSIQYPPDERLDVALRALRGIKSGDGCPDTEEHVNFSEWAQNMAADAIAEIEKMGLGCPSFEPLPPVKWEEK